MARRRKAAPEPEVLHDESERWLISFADMMTLLFAVFMILFAISSVNTSKFEALQHALQDAFSGKVLSGGKAVMKTGASEPPQRAAAQPPLPSLQALNAMPQVEHLTPAQVQQEKAAAAVEQEDFRRLKRRIDDLAKREGLQGRVRVTIRRRGLVIQLLTDKVFFDSGQAVIKPQAERLVSKIAVVIRDERTHPIVVEGHTDLAADCELAVVVGGDGSILRGAEVTWGIGTPVLGVNLGHVGFLAEAEVDDVEDVIDAIVERRWTPEDRLALDVRAFRDGELVTHTFALNEASVEKAARERMIEVVVEIDNRPLSRWGCDGVVLATPTGSTAYNFSAGGPIVWPRVEALLVVPISAHALFARPLVVAPDSLLAVEVIARTDGVGVLWCDGRRAVDLPPGARIEVRRADQPVRLARLHQAPFTDRLVAKFDLPVQGWRGSSERRRRLEGDHG